MMRVLQILLIAGVGYAVCAVAGYFLVMAVSTNRHDKSVEAVMTAVFVVGPLGAIAAGILSAFRGS